MTWKSYTLVTGAGLVATYLGLSPPGAVDTPPPSRRERTPPAQTSAEINELARGLQIRVRSQAEYQAPARNPFRFRTVSPRVAPLESAPAPAAAPAAAVVAPPPVLPAITLAGMAFDVVDGTTRRTAILSMGLDVLLVRAGDAVGVDYRVESVEEAAVVLISPRDGSKRTLSFTP